MQPPKKMKQRKTTTLKSDHDDDNENDLEMKHQDHEVHRNDPIPHHLYHSEHHQASIKKFELADQVLYKRKPQVLCPMCRMFMNSFPESLNSEEYEPSVFEEVANILTHGLPFPFFVYLFYKLFAEVVNTRDEFVAACLYCISLLALFIVSTSYHVMCLIYGKFSPKTYWFRIVDYATIYLFIAACYTPFLMVIQLGVSNFWGRLLTIAVWILACCGLIKAFSEGRLLQKISNATLFNVMGWIALIGIPQSMFIHVPLEAYIGLFFGGGCFSFGIVFLNGDGVIPFSHAWWHLISVSGILSHFLSIYCYMFQLDEMFHPEQSSFNSKVVWMQIVDTVKGERKLFGHSTPFK